MISVKCSSIGCLLLGITEFISKVRLLWAPPGRTQHFKDSAVLWSDRINISRVLRDGIQHFKFALKHFKKKNFFLIFCKKRFQRFLFLFVGTLDEMVEGFGFGWIGFDFGLWAFDSIGCDILRLWILSAVISPWWALDRFPL
ncbi:unnamed protein product [Rhizophagus irregularis]|nr:unnamed protein product [Rhizophagus irregularis]